MTTSPDGITYPQSIAELLAFDLLPGWQSTYRPAGQEGLFGYADDLARVEFYEGGGWKHPAWTEGATFTGPLVAGGDGAAPITFTSGIISVPASQSLSIRVASATQTITMGAPGAGLGNALTITAGAGGNTLDAANPNTVTIGNQLTSARYRSTQPTYNLTGVTTFPSVVFLNSNFTTTGAAYPGGGNAYLYRFTIASDTANVTENAAGFGLMDLSYNIGGGNYAGARRVLKAVMTSTGSIAPSGSMQFDIASFHSSWSHSAGGTDTAANSKGLIYTFYPQVVLNSGATNWALVNIWGEGDIAVMPGASVRDIFGRSTVLLAEHRVAGTRGNVVDLVAGQPKASDSAGGDGAVPTFTHGYTFNFEGSRWPMASTAELITSIFQTTNGIQARNCKFYPMLSTKGVAFGYVNFSKQSGHSVHVPGASIDGAGQIRSSNLLISHTSTGIGIDTPVQRVTAVTASTAGTGAAGLNNYYPGDIVYGEETAGVRGQYEITNTKVIAAAVVSGGTGGTPGAVTITGTTGTGTKFQATGTIDGSGVLTGALVVSVAGDYTVNPTTTTAEPVTGGGLTGATVSLGIGALTVAVLAPDVSASAPATITPTGGSGAGLVLSPTWAPRNTITLSGSGGPTAFGGAIAEPVPVTKTGNFTMGATETSVICNGAGAITVTLPAASSNTGQWRLIKTISAAGVVQSASSNVVPLAGGAAGTAILAATAGRWARLQSDGTNWVIMAGN